MSFNWKSIVKTVAPVLGTALGGGPFGGMAAKFIAGKLFGDDVAETGQDLEDRISAALEVDPDALLKIKQADQEFDAKMKRMDVDILAIDAADRDSARSLAKETSLLPQIILASIYNCGFILIIYAVFFSELNLVGTQKDIALFLLGILSTGLVQVNNFFFGSSSGSKEKTIQMSHAQHRPG